MNVIQIRPLVCRPRPRIAACETTLCCRDIPRAQLEHEQFDAMRTAFQPHGGFVSGDELVHGLRRRQDQPSSVLEHWLMSRMVLNVSWRGKSLIPVFQFDLTSMTIRPCCARTIDELKAVFDDWELALWFATPNTWLGSAEPVALLADDDSSVLQAARADRFVSRG